jgi:predicted SAM-dependent methyltransferase
MTMKLHIGGTESKEGWKILNIQAGPNVDFIGSCTDLSQFQEESISTVYASHVFEHLSHRGELMDVLAECQRILAPGGNLKISVPDMVVLSRLFLVQDTTVEQRYELMLMMFGGQLDAHDFHKVGCFEDLLALYLMNVGFSEIKKVEEFGLFDDYSSQRFGSELISLNMIATKSLENQ